MRKTKKKKRAKFSEKDFVKSLWKTMEAQGKKNPAVALLHERLEGTIRLIGLTGGIAAGKSTISALFEKAGMPVIDADKIAREVVMPHQTVYRKIVAAFGSGVVNADGTLDREAIARIVFADPSKRQLLESITHPAIFRQIADRVKALKKKGAKTVLIDAALLFESDLHRQMDKTIVVLTNPAAQLQRLMKRDELSEGEAWQRILSQMPPIEKEKLADYVVDNSGPLEETKRQVNTILAVLSR